MDNIAGYLSKAIGNIMSDAIKISYRSPKELFFLLGFSKASKRAEEMRRRYEAKGVHIPPFLIASVAANCNLTCAGCYARANGSCGDAFPAEQLGAARWKELFEEAENLGVVFTLLAGGEPMLRRDVLEKAGEVRKMIFPVFTNGTLIDEDCLALFDRRRNLIPILSIEGNREATDDRRGSGVYELLIRGMEKLKRRGILFGASVTVTAENIGEVTGDDFVRNLRQNGCSIVFYVEYVPVDGKAALAPGEGERLFLENRLHDLRREHKMLFLSFPGDEKALGGCLAAGRGFFHINPAGGAEPCPFSPYSDRTLKDHTIFEALQSPLFQKLRSKEFLLTEHQGGCVLFDRREEVAELL